MANSFNRIAHHKVQKWKIDNNAHCIFFVLFFAKIAKVCSEKKNLYCLHLNFLMCYHGRKVGFLFFIQTYVPK